jgi:tetratricopeptide (TPR) repeat protein
MPRDGLPSEPPERERLYRSTLAQLDRSVLIIADNASSEAQVSPLLPGAGPHKVLVTSRDTLAALSGPLREVPVLDDQSAVDLLDEALRIARPGDDRVATARESAARLARQCGGLPLALQIVAAVLKADWTLPPAELADDLAAEASRLDRLTYDDGSEPGTSPVAAAFDLSYRRLDERDARVFRLISIAPGPDISTIEAAVLAALPVREARSALARLAKAHLAEAVAARATPVPRWRMHDLVRAYARRLSDEQATADGRATGLDQLFDYYVTTAAEADSYMRYQRGSPQYLFNLPSGVGPEVSDRDSALTWLDTHRASLVAAVSLALASGRDRVVLGLPGTLTTYLYWHRHFDDFLNTMNAAYEVAHRLGEVDYEAMALTSLSPVLREVGRFEDAVDAARGAATLYALTGDAYNRALALVNLGIALRDRQELEEAITAYQDAIGILRQAGDLLNEATDVSRRAADLFAAAGDRHNQGVALDNLCVALGKTGHVAEAVAAGERAIAIFTETGEQAALTKATNHLAAARAAKP